MDAVRCCGVLRILFRSLVLNCGIIMLRKMLEDAVGDVDCCDTTSQGTSWAFAGAVMCCDVIYP